MSKSPGSEGTLALRRRGPLLVLAGAALLSVGVMGAIPQDGFQLPLAAVLAALLPLQLAALWLVFRRP
jgi:hypothetical protein